MLLRGSICYAQLAMQTSNGRLCVTGEIFGRFVRGKMTRSDKRYLLCQL